jgi:hypothetical protein
MKKKLLMAGIIVVLMALTLTMSGCDLLGLGRPGPGGPGPGHGPGTETGSGTVIVQNLSTYSVDNLVRVEISNANNRNDVVRSQRSVGRNQQVTFSNVPTNISYRIHVTESNGSGSDWSSSNFTLFSGETATFNYTGTGVTRQW